MKIPVRELTVGDILRLNDWQLHVIAVEHDVATAVLTSEFGFLLNFTRDETVDIVGDVGSGRQRRDARERPGRTAGVDAAITAAEVVVETRSGATSATTHTHRPDSRNSRSCGMRSRAFDDVHAVVCRRRKRGGPVVGRRDH